MVFTLRADRTSTKTHLPRSRQWRSSSRVMGGEKRHVASLTRSVALRLKSRALLIIVLRPRGTRVPTARTQGPQNGRATTANQQQRTVTAFPILWSSR